MDFANRAKQITTTTGTGNITLSATQPYGFVPLAEDLGIGEEFDYTIENATLTEWEVGRGELIDANTLQRNTVLKSSNSDNLVDFSAGTKVVFNSLSAETLASLGIGNVESVNGQTGVVELDADDIDETDRLFVDQTEKDTWNAKQDDLGFTPEPAIPTGTTDQYVRGNKTLGSFASAVLGVALAGLSFGSTAAIADGDTTLQAFGKLQAQSTAVQSTLTTKADLVGGLVPAVQLPGFVDDILEYANLAALPVTGESGKLYVTLDTNKTYRWSGSAYVVVSDTLTLGTTSSTAFRGDYGQTAYDHTFLTTNPHSVTASQVGLGSVENTALSTWAGTSNITTLGTIGTGTWQGSVIAPTYGGTGINNGVKTIALGGNFVTSGAYSLTLTQTGATNVTLPTSGTLAILGANSFTATQTITPAVNTSALVISGASLTGSSTIPFVSIAGIWNSSATPTAFLMNLTDTASAGSPMLMDLQVGGVSKFCVYKTGQVNFQSNLFVTGGVNTTHLVVNGASRISSPSSSILTLQNSGLTDFSLLQFGGTSVNFGAIGRDAVNGFTFQSAAGTSTWNNASTANSGTVANRYLVGIAAPTLTSTGTSVTNTVASTFYIGGAPTDSTNTTSTTKYALNVAAGNSFFGGDVILPTTGKLIFGSATDIYITYASVNDLYVAEGHLACQNGIWVDQASGGRTYGMRGQSSRLGLFANSTEYASLLSTGNFGVNTTTPRRKIDILDASNPQLRLTYTDNSVYSEFQTDSSGNLTISATGTKTTFSTQIENSRNGAVSAPPVSLTGTWYSGGSATTTKPQLLLEPSGTTSTGWSTTGTGLGINAASGFTGNLIDTQVAGLSAFKVDYAGQLTASYTVTSLRSSANAFPPSIDFYKSRGTFGSPAVISVGDELGNCAFRGYTGSAYAAGAWFGAISTSTTGGAFLYFATCSSGGSPVNRFTVTDHFNLLDGVNLTAGTSTGSIIGGSSSQKIAFWGKTPIVQPTTSITGATYVANAGIDTCTFDGFTIGQVVKALRNEGLLA